MKEFKNSISEADIYLEMAADQLKSGENKSFNPVIVNCIMSMIKSVDALMLERRGKTNKDHSKTAKQLKKLYRDNLISEKFSSNVDSVRRFVVDKKTDIQYRNKKSSKKEAEKAVKSARRLLRKTRSELN